MCRTDEHITKQCRVCEQSKPIEIFKRCGKTKAGKPKYDAICKECKRIEDARYRADMSKADILRYQEAHKKYRHTEKGRQTILKIKDKSRTSGWSTAIYWFVCESCDVVELRTRPVIQKRCGKCISKALYYRKYRPQTNRIIGAESACSVCGGSFIVVSINQSICSEKCRDLASRRHKRIARKKHRRKYGNESNNKDRARKHGVVFDSGVTSLRIFNRDKYKCQSCGVKVQNANHLLDDAAEVDHIVPLSIGGPHTWSNVQTLCRRCNREKGSSYCGQLVMNI